MELQTATEIVTIDRQGRWWYEGNQIIHPDVLALFKRSLKKDPRSGDLHIHYQGQTLPVEVESCPFFIRDIHISRDEQGDLETIVLVLDDDSEESLAPDSLVLAQDGVLRAAIKKGEFMGCCLPAAQFRLAELFDQQDDGSFSLQLGKKSYSIHHHLQ